MLQVRTACAEVSQGLGMQCRPLGMVLNLGKDLGQEVFSLSVLQVYIKCSPPSTTFSHNMFCCEGFLLLCSLKIVDITLMADA